MGGVGHEHPIVLIRQGVHPDHGLAGEILGHVGHQAVLAQGDHQVVRLEEKPVQVLAVHLLEAPGLGHRGADDGEGGPDFVVGSLRPLDPLSSRRLDELILELRDSLGSTIVVVTHELQSIFTIASNSVFLDPVTKTMLTTGDPKQLRDHSEIPEVRAFLTRGEVGGAEAGV